MSRKVLQRTGSLLRLLVIVGLLALAGCNTVAGAGKDIKNAGQGIENAADRNK